MTKHFCKGMAVFAVFTVFAVAIGCKQTVTVSEKKDTTPSAEVTELQTEALAGAIRVTWTDPADEDLWGIEITSQQDIVSRSVAPPTEKCNSCCQGRAEP